jgi:predicted small lipoprotein YifL
MSRTRLSVACAILVIAYLSLGLSGCGQMGPLTLPDDTASDDDSQNQDDAENER